MKYTPPGIGWIFAAAVLIIVILAYANLVAVSPAVFLICLGLLAFAVLL